MTDLWNEVQCKPFRVMEEWVTIQHAQLPEMIGYHNIIIITMHQSNVSTTHNLQKISSCPPTSRLKMVVPRLPTMEE